MKGLGVPPCDLENLADAVKLIMKECEDAGLFCELQMGTLLGENYAKVFLGKITFICVVSRQIFPEPVELKTSRTMKEKFVDCRIKF